MTRASYIFVFLILSLLFGCDRALDNRYEGLVVVPIQEVPVDPVNGGNVLETPIDAAGTLVRVDIPRRRPDTIPLRELTSSEAIAAADEAAQNASLATDSLLAAQDAQAEALTRLSETQFDLTQILEEQARLAEEAVPLGTDGLDLDIDGLETSDLETDGTVAAPDAFESTPLLDDSALSDNPPIAEPPLARPTPFPQSFYQLDRFLAEQAERERLTAEADRLAAIALDRVTAAEQLATERAEIERLAAEAAADAKRAEDAIAARREQQAAAEIAAAEAATEAARLAGTEQINEIPTLAPAAVSDTVSDTVPATVEVRSISLPLSYDTAVPIDSVQDLQQIFDEADYNLARLIGGEPAPALILQNLPRDLNGLRENNAPLQRELLIKSVLPLCLVANARIQAERDYILSNEHPENTSGPVRDPVIRGLRAKYQAATHQDLLAKAQTIPVSLCLAYAILASDWGANLTALDQNALFGSWVMDLKNKTQVFPATVLDDEGAKSVSFPSLQASTDAFALFINRDHAFKIFREERNRRTQQGNLLSGLIAAEYVAGLTPNDSTLISTLIQTIRDNQLDQYNLVRLQNGPRRAIPVL